MKKILYDFMLFVLLASCQNARHLDSLAKREFIQQINNMYELDYLMDHFPYKWHNDVMRNNDKWNASYYRCDDFPGFSNYRFFGEYDEKASVALIDSLEQNIYKCMYLFSDSTIMKLDIPCLILENSFKQTVFDTLMIPIYDFQDSEFYLGKEDDSLFFNGRYWYGEHSILPSDLVVYVIDAQPGNFWRNKELADKEPRPVLPEKWKHGYSRGIGVSRSCERVCWWVMAW
ncbi:hypothetical protein [Ruminobacter amylophilus]|uniref:hypothetical protein n=1 Tax=Ruminobacter amylophilus TaxID=867 RepID=UPI00386E14D5